MPMRVDEIDAELVAANPWWRDLRGWEADDVQLRAARASPLAYEARPLEDMSPGGLHVLRGPRRVGKSTALKQTIAERIRSGTPPRTVLHMSVEGRTDRDVVDMVRRAAGRWLDGSPGERLWMIDEITGVHGPWPAMIKRLRDSHPSFSADTVVLTGSSSSSFDEARELLAGRRNTKRSERVLFQMGFAAVARALGVDLPPSPHLAVSDLASDPVIAALVSEYRPWLPALIEGWDTYLRVGGYPEAVSSELAPSAEGEGMLLQDLWDVVHGDAFAGSDLSHTQTQALLRGITTSLTSLLSVHALSRSANIAHGTATQRLDALRRAFVAFPVHREQGLAPKPRSQAKWYFTDPKLAQIATRLGAGAGPIPGALSEQQVAVAILRALELEAPGAAMRHDRLLYYRSTTRTEIDFVSPDFAQTCVESKFVDRKWGRAFQTIEGSGRATGIVATRSGLERHRGGWALPAGFIAFLLRA